MCQADRKGARCMELKIFRDALPAAGASCTLKAELPLETEILISDYLPPVFKLVKCFVRPVVLQKQLQTRAADAGRLPALYGLLSGRGRRGPLPDRAEAALHQNAGAAGIPIYGVGGTGGGTDGICQLPGSQPPPYRGTGRVRAGGIGSCAEQNRAHHCTLGGGH